MLVLVIPPSFYIQHFFHNFVFSEEIAKSKSIILTSYFNTLIFKFNTFKISFQVFFENFSVDRWYQPLQKHQRHLLKKSNSIINIFKVTKFSKEWKVWPKTHFPVFALFVGNFSNKHHYNLLKILWIFCFWYFCPKWLVAKWFVFKVDWCIKVVALIKITTVFWMLEWCKLDLFYVSYEIETAWVENILQKTLEMKWVPSGTNFCQYKIVNHISIRKQSWIWGQFVFPGKTKSMDQSINQVNQSKHFCCFCKVNTYKKSAKAFIRCPIHLNRQKSLTELSKPQ